MEFVNSTPLLAAYTQGLDPDGREHLVVVLKGTFAIPPKGGTLVLAEEQQPFVFADTFTGKPGLSAMRRESEFALRKPKCDVLLVGSAHAPEGKAVPSVPVALRVGRMTKHFEVVGKRHWTAGVMGLKPSRAEPFTAMPISYDRAFGGGEPVKGNPELRNTYAANPVGVGFFEKASDDEILGTPVPNTQDPSAPVLSPRKRYRPMAFGPVGRNFAERVRFAGTYDAAWQENTFPFLPRDFDDRYFQAAPDDQQIPYPAGGELVQFVNLTPVPQPPFALPAHAPPVEVTHASDGRVTAEARLDTIHLDPDAGRCELVWRASFPLRRGIQQVRQVVVGHMPSGWHRARALGKTYYPSLQKLVEARRGGS